MPTPWQATPEQERDLQLLEETQFIGPSLTGYFTWRMMEEWREKQDAKSIATDVTLAGALAKTPWQWIDAACRAHGLPTKGRRAAKAAQLAARLTDPEHLRSTVRGLRLEERLVLKRVLDAGGWVKFAALVAEFGDQEQDGWFWNEQAPVSTIGRVRLCALLFVGKGRVGGRGATPIALIPQDLRAPLAKILEADAARLAQMDDYALTRTLAAVAEYYADKKSAARLPRAWLEAFLRAAAAQGRDVFGEWEDLQRFDYFLFRQRIEGVAHVLGFHLSEWTHTFLRRKYLGEFWLPAKRRMLKTVAAFYEFGAQRGEIEPSVAQRVVEAVKTIAEGKGELGYVPPPPPLGGEVIMVATRGKESEPLTFNDRWLTIVCAADYGKDWDNVYAATQSVTDGAIKAKLIERLERLGPEVWDALSQADESEIEHARRWFREERVLTLSAW